MLSEGTAVVKQLLLNCIMILKSAGYNELFTFYPQVTDVLFLIIHVGNVLCVQ